VQVTTMATAILNMSTTGVIITICGITLLAWEVIAFVAGKKQALLSTWFQKLGFRSPAAVFVVGALAGHFWMYFPPTVDDESVQCPQCHAWLVLSTDPKTGKLVTTDIE